MSPTKHALLWVQKNLTPLAQRDGDTSVGRLKWAKVTWEKITQDPWVLSTISGYKIEFWSNPIQTHPPAPLNLPQKQIHLMTKEVQILVQKKAVIAVSDTQSAGFLSRIFLVPKKDGSQRPVINLRPLNQFVVWEHFKMEGVHLIEHLIQEGDWMVKLDLKDTCFAIPIHQDY